MNVGELFIHAVTALPSPVRERLDGDASLDWAALEHSEIGVALSAAARDRHRLPRPMEALVHRLVRDVGIVPADVSEGIERQSAASAWIHWVTIEADGESYQLRNDRSGEVHVGIHPEAVAGYATLSLELAAAVHEAGERWLAAGERWGAMPEGARSRLAECAVRMHTHLRAQPEAISGRPTSASLARTLEYAWNTQSAEVRAALADLPVAATGGTHAPRRSYFSPAAGYRLSACNVGEIRWLRALAEHAETGVHDETGVHAETGVRAETGVHDERKEETPPPFVAIGAAGEALGATFDGTGVQELGTDPERLTPDTEVAELGRIANQLPNAFRERMEEAYGTGGAHALARLQSPPGLDWLRSELASGAPGGGTPRWFDRLAVALMQDTGAQTRHGLRTGSMRLRPRREPDNVYEATEAGTEVVRHLTPVGLVEQVRLGLTFARDAWTGLTELRNARKEGSWALAEAEGGGRELTDGERETLEAAREIGRALDGLEQALPARHSERGPTALEQAAMAAEALRTVGPTTRTAAGWPGGAGAPNARSPRDVARVATIAETLHGEIRVIANRLIAGWIAEAQAYGESRRG